MLNTRQNVTSPHARRSSSVDPTGDAGPISSSSGYTTEIAETIHEIDLKAWEQLCPHRTDPFMNPGLLYAAETSMSPEASCWYLLFRDSDHRAVAAAAMSTYVLDSTVLATGVSAKIAKAVSRVIPSLTRMKILFLGMPFSASQSHVRFAPDADRRLVVALLSELLETKARETKSELIVAKELQESELEWASSLEEYGYRRADSLPMNYMLTWFGSFNDYLESLRSGRRRELKVAEKKFRNASLTPVVCCGEEAAERFTDRAHKLYENVLFHSENRAEYLPREFFVELAKQLPETAKFIYVYDQDQLVSFGCWLESETVFTLFYVGFDYERNRDLGLYFNMLFHCVDLGLKSNSRELWVGANADEVKHHKLCTYQEPRYLYIRGGWWLARLLLKPAFHLFFPPHKVLYPWGETPTALKVTQP